MHFEIAGADGARSQKFYADLFDWDVNVVEEMGNYGLVMSPEGEPGIGGGIMQTPTGNPYLTIYVEVADLEATVDKAVALGGNKIMEPTPVPGVGLVSMVLDPDGNLVGVLQPE